MCIIQRHILAGFVKFLDSKKSPNVQSQIDSPPQSLQEQLQEIWDDPEVSDGAQRGRGEPLEPLSGAPVLLRPPLSLRSTNV